MDAIALTYPSSSVKEMARRFFLAQILHIALRPGQHWKGRWHMADKDNRALLIFTTIGGVVLFYYFGRVVAKLIDKHNAEKLKRKRMYKWFYR
jgi:hypothetical protein